MLGFLDKWFFKKKRRMNDKEIEMVGAELGVDPNVLSNLQDNYLEHKKIVNTRDLHEYLKANEQTRNGEISVPPSLARYLVKTKNPYSDVQARVYEKKEPYNPFKMNDWEHKVKNSSMKKNKEGRFAERIFRDLDGQNDQKNPDLEETLKNKGKNSININQIDFSP